MKTASYFNRYIREVLSQGTNGTMKTFIIARHKIVQWKHLSSQGIKGYNKNIYYRKAQMAIDMWPLRGQDKNKPTPEGSHVF